METVKAYQGNDITFTRQMTVSDDNTLLDLTNYEFKLGISETLEDLSAGGTPTYVTDDFPIISTLTNSTTRTITISNAISSTIPTGTYFYEIQVTDENDKISTVEIGKFLLLKRVVE
jgi:hypothetical protein